LRQALRVLRCCAVFSLFQPPTPPPPPLPLLLLLQLLCVTRHTSCLCMYRDDDIDREVLRAGASGYVLQMMRRGTRAEVRQCVCVGRSRGRGRSRPPVSKIHAAWAAPWFPFLPPHRLCCFTPSPPATSLAQQPAICSRLACPPCGSRSIADRTPISNAAASLGLLPARRPLFLHH